MPATGIDIEGLYERYGPGGRAHRGPAHPLASAYELDDAPAFERFFFVTSERPFAVATVTDAVGRFAAPAADPGGTSVRLDLPSSFGQSSFLLRKDLPR